MVHREISHPSRGFVVGYVLRSWITMSIRRRVSAPSSKQSWRAALARLVRLALVARWFMVLRLDWMVSFVLLMVSWIKSFLVAVVVGGMVDDRVE
ncbi:hypothetical protein HanRHA438_Chr04g0150261 [Helianthus annuus]|nr:hypothetical protein HanRHA438_Chr04g0150261 [Helianthus annuus]